MSSSDATTTSHALFHGTPSKDALRNFIAGTASGFACKIAEYPADTIKVIQQTAAVGTYSGPLDVFKKTVKAHGFLSLYQGLSSPLVGAMAENAVVFTAYKRFQRMLGVEENQWASRISYAWAGMGAGFFSAAVLTPVELVKCNIQVQQAAQRGGTSTTNFKGPIDVVIQTVKKEGIQGLYRGHVACLARELPGNFAWFGVYEATLREFQERFGYKDRASVPLGLKSLAGSIGGVCYWAVPFPFDTAKSLLQTDARFRGWSMANVLKTVYKEQGVRGLYHGLTVTCLRAAPAHALIFFSFEWIDHALLHW